MEQSGKKHSLEVLPPDHLDSSEMVIFGFIASVYVYLTFRQAAHSYCGVTGLLSREALGTDNMCFFV